MDTQVIEFLGRNYLVNQLLEAGLEVARPERDKGIDLIAYLDEGDVFVAVPIQMKASSERSFSISRKYHKFPNMLLVYVWQLRSDLKSEIYAMTYAESVKIGDEMGWTQTSSWKDNNHYSSTTVGSRLQDCLEPYRVTLETWKPLIRKVAGHGSD
jgi:hypothetical protein